MRGDLLANGLAEGMIMRSRKVTAMFFTRRSRTARVAGAIVASVTALLALTMTALGSPPRDWPPFLRASDEYPAQIASTVRRLWSEPTFSRTVSADAAPVPVSFYLRFVDAPDLTAAAARHLGLTT